MTTTLRRYGMSDQRSKDWIVVHTDETPVYRQLRNLKACHHTVPYYQMQRAKMSPSNPLGEVWVAEDLYFAATQEDRLRRLLGMSPRIKAANRGTDIRPRPREIHVNNCVNLGVCQTILDIEAKHIA